MEGRLIVGMVPTAPKEGGGMASDLAVLVAVPGAVLSVLKIVRILRRK